MDSDKLKKARKALQTITLMSILTPPQESLYKQRESTFKTGTEEEKYIKMGLKKFHYGSEFVWAASKKAADKKAKKQNLI